MTPHRCVRQRVVSGELAEVVNVVLAAEPAIGRREVERVLRVVGALVDVNEAHAVDADGRCLSCRGSPLVCWRRRKPCTVWVVVDHHIHPWLAPQSGLESAD